MTNVHKMNDNGSFVKQVANVKVTSVGRRAVQRIYSLILDFNRITGTQRRLPVWLRLCQST